MPMCCAFGCSSKNGHGKRLFLIPSGKHDAQRRKVWLHRIGRANFKPTLASRLCEDHFTEDQFEPRILEKLGVKKLKPNATPSIFSHRKPPKQRKPPARRDAPLGSQSFSHGPEVHIMESFTAGPSPSSPSCQSLPVAGPSSSSTSVPSLPVAGPSSSFSSVGCCMQQHSPMQDRQQLHCQQCTYVASSLSDWKKHQCMHTGEPFYQCSHCSKAFLRKHSLVTHLCTHTGERPHQCSQCGKAFLCKSSLVQHSRTHTGERPYQCSQCGKAYLYSSSLVKHSRAHTGERPHQCSYCDKAFAGKSHLVAHLRIHTGERPFRCHLCPRAFPQKCGLDGHVRTHTRERPFRCHFCPEAFCHRPQRKKHEEEHSHCDTTPVLLEESKMSVAIDTTQAMYPACQESVNFNVE